MEEQVREKGSGLATAALILGLIGALGFVFVFPPFVFGATAIVLGLLSGNGSGIALRAKIGMFMGGLSMALFVIIMAAAINLLRTEPGLMEEFKHEYNRVYEELENNGFVMDDSFI